MKLSKPNIELFVAIRETGLSQTKLARILEISESRLSRIMNGHVEANELETEALCKVLGRTPEEINLIPKL